MDFKENRMIDGAVHTGEYSNNEEFTRCLIKRQCEKTVDNNLLKDFCCIKIAIISRK